MSRGELYLAYAHSQTNPQTSTKCGANRSSRLTASQNLDLWPPKTPRNARCVLRFIYPFPDESAHVCQIWYQSVQPFGSLSWICATLVRLLATGRAVSRKNTPKNNIYTSKIIIPARTTTSLTFFTAIFVALGGALAKELMICCRHVRT